MTKIELGGMPEDTHFEDGGQAAIMELGDDSIFVRIQSWDESKAHSEWRKLVGKRLRVTIEVVED